MTSCPNSRSAKNVAKGETPGAPTSLELETTNEHAPPTRAIAKKALPSVVNRIGTAPHETTRTIRAHRTTPPMRKKIKSPKRTLKKGKKLHGTMCDRDLPFLFILFGFRFQLMRLAHTPLARALFAPHFLNLFQKRFCAGARSELTVTFL